MSTPNPPIPPVALKDHCSVIYNNTLYTFQPDAFQSLGLEAGGKWSELPMGVPTNGSVCVQGSPKGQDSLFVVGGITNASMPNYSGLQRYIFQTRKWETVKLRDKVAQDRQGHGSAYLNASSSIIIYAGYQDRIEVPSSQTFSVSMLSPYNIESYSSSMPPLLKPLLMPWNTSHALMLGGDKMNKDLYTFGPGPGQGWRRMDQQLSEGLKDSTKVQTAIINNRDGSKVLQIFDMSVSPNSISIQELPSVTDKTSLGRRYGSSTISSATETQQSRKRKRETTSERPTYNSTLASQTQRNGFSLAQDSTGLIAFSGGEPTNSDEVLCLFNQTGNQWIDPNRFFAAVTTSRPLSSPSSTPTSVMPAASSIGSASPTISPSSGIVSAKNHSLTILGATLGAVFGLAAILIIILLLLRCLRRQRETSHKRKTSDYPSDNKHEMDFADRGVNYMQEAGGSFSGRGNHQHTDSAQSANSLAIMSGSLRADSSQSKRGFLHRPGDSNGSTKSLFSRAKSPLAPSPPPISGPILNNPRDHNNVQASPEPRTEPRTDTGWSRYFTNNSSTNLPTGNTHHDSASRPTTYTSGTQSDYASSRIASSNPHESAEVQPLSLRTNAHHPSNSRIVSPTSGIPIALQPGISSSSKAESSSPPSPSTLVSDVNDDEYQNGDRSHESEGMASWTPIAASDRGSTWEDRPISSVYTESVTYPHPGERVRIPNFPRVPSTARNSTRNSTARNSQVDPSADTRGLRSLASRDLRTPPTGDQERDLPEVGSRRVVPPVYGDDREMRPYPRQSEEWDPRVRRHEPEDMSWLNLGR